MNWISFSSSMIDKLFIKQIIKKQSALSALFFYQELIYFLTHSDQLHSAALVNVQNKLDIVIGCLSDFSI